ncbi:HD-GYP domain-containing protein [Solirubrobacter sp. CPCC 204708]|uniref:HD-GYP domain-containing protein n=1 Tax=Solirubrobacter deserti TaxID=2282478 RepID=A0ABT4RN05_9ACTN|nr:HD domain-containing phosphohydrolase [Solirubrobacter deserti]MBE2315042.1 HD-GYP domain-containing protein [Solirubrobacter deserti]MDA0139957.1 HD-GYP domain-containing protein [Solirubrobacter deserti]
MLRSRLLPFVMVLAALVPVAAVVLVGTRPAGMTPPTHFVLVATAAAIASLASLALSIAGARARDGRAVLMGTAFSTMTALFMVHAFATPTIFTEGFNGMMPLAGGLSVPIGAALLALTALPALRRPHSVRPLVTLQAALFAGVLAFGVFGLLNPTVLPAVPQAKSSPALLLLFAGAFCLGLLIIRAVRTYLLTRRGADLAIALGCAWLSVTLWANLVIGPMTIGYFIGHALEICAVAMVAIPTALDLRRAGASRALVGDLTATELVEREEAYLGARVRALMVRLERRDRSTEEHTRRVAYLAARVGEELKLSPTARRHLAVGGLLHDIGKLSVPLEILNKPGKLTDAEFAAIKRHPEDGRRLLDELGGFPEAVRELVSDHHERLDGSGYPRGLTAMDMSLETRILAVCDVYDALVSDRVYRAAWTPERAFALLEEESDAYDQTVVAALKQAVCPSFVADLATAPVVAPRVRSPRTV